MDVGKFKGFKIPVPVKGQVMLEVVDAEDVQGKTPDDNGEVSSGFKLTVSIKSPEDALMSDGSSAIGYTFAQTWWLPRQSLRDAKPQIAAGMEHQFAHLLEAAFGPDFAEKIDPAEWIGRQILANIAPDFDDFNGVDICKINAVLTEDDLARKSKSRR